MFRRSQKLPPESLAVVAGWQRWYKEMSAFTEQMTPRERRRFSRALARRWGW